MSLDDATLPEDVGLIEPPEADGIRLVTCPNGAAAVEHPPEETAEVACNASNAARTVLEATPDAGLPSEDEIAAQYAALLDPPDAEHVATAPPSAAVDGSDVGIAMSGPDDCVLAKRVDGVATEAYAPRVYLLPGELGCTPWTALAENLSRRTEQADGDDGKSSPNRTQVGKTASCQHTPRVSEDRQGR